MVNLASFLKKDESYSTEIKRICFRFFKLCVKRKERLTNLKLPLTGFTQRSHEFGQMLSIQQLNQEQKLTKEMMLMKKRCATVCMERRQKQA